MEGIDCELCGEDIDYCNCLRCDSCEELFLVGELKTGPAESELCPTCFVRKEICVLG